MIIVRQRLRELDKLALMRKKKLRVFAVRRSKRGEIFKLLVLFRPK
jgi:hypothetical protein